jgi:sugar phosphate isomerase/epimerase
MNMTRKDFIKTSAGAAAMVAMPVSGAAMEESGGQPAATRGKPKRGVSVYSYCMTYGFCMTLEDCFEDIHDMGATCFELLTSHIDNYPYPSAQWIDHYWGLCEKYKLEPAEMGMWGETHLHRGPKMTDDQIVAEISRDLKLANTLGFHSVRMKITCMNRECDPEPGWQSYFERLIPVAEKYDVAMLSECHSPTLLTRQHINDYLEFADKHKTKHFGINADFGTFQNFSLPEGASGGGFGSANKVDLGANPKLTPRQEGTYSKPEDIIRILPYCRTCHAKFNYMDPNFEERTIPYKQIIQLMVDQGWNGNLISEYEGPMRDDPGYLGDQLRRQHIMMKRILGY